MPPPLEGLSRRLLRVGVSPRRSRRYIAELNDHMDDLVAEEAAAGGSCEQVRLRALSRLGGVETLVEAMVARPELRSLSARAPVLAYLVAPPLVLMVFVIVAMVGLVAICGAFRSAASTPHWMPPAADVLVLCVNHGLPVVLGWAVALEGYRHRAALTWTVSSLVLLALTSAAGQVGVTLPAPSSKGEIDLLSAITPDAIDACARQMALELIVMLAPCVAVAAWRASQPSTPQREGNPS